MLLLISYTESIHDILLWVTQELGVDFLRYSVLAFN